MKINKIKWYASLPFDWLLLSDIEFSWSIIFPRLYINIPKSVFIYLLPSKTMLCTGRLRNLMNINQSFEMLQNIKIWIRVKWNMSYFSDKIIKNCIFFLLKNTIRWNPSYSIFSFGSYYSFSFHFQLIYNSIIHKKYLYVYMVYL